MEQQRHKNEGARDNTLIFHKCRRLSFQHIELQKVI